MPKNISPASIQANPSEPAEPESTKPGWMRIIVLDVGQGDSTLLVSPENEAILIDVGPPDTGPPAIFSVLEDLGITHLEHIFISHLQEDHMGGLKTILGKGFANAEDVINKTNRNVGETVSLGPATIQIKASNGWIGTLPPPPNADADENNLNHALVIQYGQFRYFTDGDMPGGGGNPPYQTIDFETPLAPLIGDIDVMLIPHHGSNTSTNPIFLDTLKPEVALISFGDNNEYFHPHPSVLARLKKAGVKIYTTERGSITRNNETDINIIQGNICLLTNGETYFVKAYAIDKCTPPPL
ncbi:MAG: MBL fold metallo-hydrolase [Deltaproteobacteria bacterium]|nr:MBL fold metallo-hydrolase [Deltaproteobacteria bacterium]